MTRRPNKKNEATVKVEWTPEPLWFIAGLMLFTIVLILVFGWSSVKGKHFMHPSDYRTTEGIIESSQMSRCGKAGRSFCFDIVYSYNVSSARYKSDVIHFNGNGSDFRKHVEEYVRRYPVGKKVVVFYEKGNPSFVVLEPFRKGTSPLEYMAGVAVLMSAFAGFAMYLTAKRNLRKD